jgi:hypothetical protein
MNDIIEIEVQVIEFDIVGVGGGDVDRDCYTVYFSWRLFDDAGNYFGVLFTEPAEGGRNTTVRLYTLGYTP